jgi:hypothetical protein
MKLLILTITLIQSAASMPQTSSGTANSKGPLSGEVINLNFYAPINDCGLNAQLVGIGNEADGNDCKNGNKDSSTKASSGGSS